MSATFSNGSKKQNLQLANLKPVTIARLFQLDENSIVLLDGQGYCYLPNGDEFDPTLESNKFYDIQGIPAINLPPKTKEALQTMNMELQVIQGDQQLDLIDGVILSCTDMNESSNMLYNGPQAVVMVQRLAILAVCAPDPSLDVETLDPKVKGRLADPGSFRASLLHVANQMCNAFRQADYAMKTIRACLIDLPDYFNATLEVVDQSDDKKAKSILMKTTQEIKRSSDKCSKMANLAKDTFSDVINDIDALSVAATSSKTVNERQKVELKKLKDEMDIRKIEMTAQERQLKEEYEEATMKVKEALNEYRTQVANSTGLGKLFLAAVADGVMSVVQGAAQLLPHNIFANAASSHSVGQTYVNCSKEMKFGVEMGLINTLEKIGTTLSDTAMLNVETLTDYIASLTDFLKYPAATKEGLALFEQAKNVKNFCEKNKNFLQNGDNFDNGKIKAEMSSIKASIQNTVTTICLAHEQQRSERAANGAAANSFRSQLLQADNQRINSAQQHFTAAEIKAEARRKELNESKRELTEIICKLQSIDVNTTDINEIIKYLRIGIDYIAKVKKNWEFLVTFFGNIRIIVDENLTTNVEKFIQEAHNLDSRTLMLQSALKATGYCIQVSNAANIYSVVSGKFIMPIISSIGEELALEPRQARLKHAQIQSAFDKMDQGVTDLIEEEQAKIEGRFHEQMNRYGRNMMKAVKIGNIASSKAIKY